MALPTPSQTVGPYFHIGLPSKGGSELVAPGDPHAVRLLGNVFDGEGQPVDDALIELWQANRQGRYDHPEDPREEIPLERGFSGFGRCETDGSGGYAFVTVKPGPVPRPGGGMQAPHIDVSVFARGLLKHLVTRIYFPDEREANDSDPTLSRVDPELRPRLVARVEEGALRFDIHLQGEMETPFFDV
ncbi:MAG TPA: protocatechuate 3,4-dioxygenase subunit alpha [Solirubrobacteraceae bacterium]|nr:protocatechuate 3,4-dioxygenase subunit alpha [Solirubrobacteraceae bacterium]